ncbi:MAG: EMC3/TMCO1 family protein [Candidatus Thorarchaeota archaeon]
MDFISDLLGAMAGFLEPFSRMPISAPFIVGVSVLLALVSIWATNRFSDMEKMKSDMEEVKEWQVKFKVARAAKRIMSLQGSMMSARCKPMLIFYIPFLLVFSVLGVLYGTNPVAILPFNAQYGLGFIEGWLGVNVPGSGFGMFYWSWYFLASLGLGNLIRKAGGLSVM